MHPAPLRCAWTLILCGTAGAQSFNVDVGTASPAPSPSYGGAAGQPGLWNSVSGALLGSAQPLVDLSGAATPATLTLVSGQAFNGAFDHASTSGNDALLLDDWQDAAGAGGTATWRFSNLRPGTYTLVTFAWASDNATFLDQVSCGAIDPPQTCGGVFTGLVLGVTHAVHHVVLPSGGALDVTISTIATASTVNGFQLRGETASTPFCTGSSLGTSCLGCANNGAAGRGCASSSFPSGAVLWSTGLASIGNDTLVLHATDVAGPGLFFQANGLAASPITFGDGMLCASVGIIRMGVVFPTAGVASYPGGLTPNPVSVAGAPINAGDIKHYQCWYRDAVAFCTPSTFNTSNGITLTWTP